ncbi:MAG TPA: C13 family peptidase, partial [Rhodanobacteraceae bacterium]|nr:C13 family peptidase [Rhodanobacteraceae bacterium]
VDAIAAPAAQATSSTAQPVDADPAATLLSDAGWPRDAPTPEQVIYSQHELLARALAHLKSRTPGKVNLYAIVFAGDGSQNVFRNEAEYFDKLFTRRFDAEGHVIVLENNPASLATRPLATWTNLEDALDGVAAKMDPTRDILLLYFTTHGSKDHTLLVDMDPLSLDQIGAGDLPGILAGHPFKYKVIIVNACYSGGFVPPLNGRNTMIITAARSDRSSFGCGEQSQLTWFGHAFLVDALNRTGDFAQAFQFARKEVAQWEKRDSYTPSEPQMDIGAGIQAQLNAWEKPNPPGAPVPFHAAASKAKPSPSRPF